jgi:hypothetical protein
MGGDVVVNNASDAERGVVGSILHLQAQELQSRRKGQARQRVSPSYGSVDAWK